MFKFQEGETVALVSDESMDQFQTGAQGVVWALYDTEPPAYEVNFRNADGEEYGAVLHEHELTAVSSAPRVLEASYARSAA